jgi:RNA polymerase sigma factor (sigma-70 family)
MEHLALQNGVLEPLEHEQYSKVRPEHPGHGDRPPEPRTVWRAETPPSDLPAGDQDVLPDPARPLNRGYRRDSPPETLALLHRAQSGDGEAFAELYRSHVDRVTKYVAACLRDRSRDAVPDIVQDAFCEAFADLPAAHHDVTGWFLAHAAKARRRHEWSVRRYTRATITTEQELQRTGSAAGADEPRPPTGRTVLVQALARLAADQRRAVQLRFLDGLPRDDQAHELNRSPEAARALETRAIRNLRTYLARTAMDATAAPTDTAAGTTSP